MSNVQNCILLKCKYDTRKKFCPPNPQAVPTALFTEEAVIIISLFEIKMSQLTYILMPISTILIDHVCHLLLNSFVRLNEAKISILLFTINN